MRVGTGTLSGCVTCEGGWGRGGQVDKLDIRTSCKRQDGQDRSTEGQGEEGQSKNIDFK